MAWVAMHDALRLLAGGVLLLASACGSSPGSRMAPSSTAAPDSTQPQALLAASPALPQAGDLTLAHEAGSILVGLSVRPAMRPIPCCCMSHRWPVRRLAPIFPSRSKSTARVCR